MAVKHVTIYECDACKAHVQSNAELHKLTMSNKEYEVCTTCKGKIKYILCPPQAEEEYVDEQP